MTYLHAVLSKQILTIDFQMYVVVAVRLRPMHIGEKGKIFAYLICTLRSDLKGIPCKIYSVKSTL